MIANNSTFALSDTKDYEAMEMIQKPEIWRPDLLQLCKSYPNSTLYFDYPLSRETYFGIGGNASVYHKLMVEGDTTSTIAVVNIVRKNSSAANDSYTLQVDSSAHTSNMTVSYTHLTLPTKRIV